MALHSSGVISRSRDIVLVPKSTVSARSEARVEEWGQRKITSVRDLQIVGPCNVDLEM